MGATRSLEQLMHTRWYPYQTKGGNSGQGQGAASQASWGTAAAAVTAAAATVVFYS